MFHQHLKKVLKKGARFCFYIKHSIVNVSPNALIVEDWKKVEEIFRKEGFKATYQKKKSIFKTEIFIYGKVK